MNYSSVNLSYLGAEYVNTGGSTVNDGSSSSTLNQDNQFSRHYAPTSQSGFIWISYLMQAISVNSSFDRIGVGVSGTPYVGIKAGAFGVFDSSWNPLITAFDTVGADLVHFVLMRVAVGAGNDTIEAWVNPPDMSSVTALGSGDNYVSYSSADFGSFLSSSVLCYLRENSGNRVSIDALRIAYGYSVQEEALSLVTSAGLPSPSAPEIGDIDINILSGSTNFIVTWNSGNGWFYAVEATENLVIPDWQPVVTNILGNGEAMSVTGEITEASSFFRVYQGD